MGVAKSHGMRHQLQSHRRVELGELDRLLDVPVREFDRTVKSLIRRFRRLGIGIRVPAAAEMDGFVGNDSRVSFHGLYEARIEHSRKMDRAEEFLMARRYAFLRARAEAALAELGLGREQIEKALATPEPAPALPSVRGEARAYALRALRELGALRNRYVEGALYIVLGLAHRYRGLGVDFADLVQEGNASLFQAIEGFDWRRDVRFRTYAQYWVQQAILKTLYNASRTVRVPIWVQKALRKIERTRQQLRDGSGSEPSSAAIGARVGMPAERVEELLATRRYAVSLDAEVGAEGTPLAALLPDESSVPVPESVPEGDLGETLRDLLVELPAREQLILNRRFGLGGTEPETLAAIAADLGITAERVRQLQNTAIHRLQHPGSKKRLESFG
jgi:RNA polymerase sigma factor (sigma-70 family)